MPVLTNLFMEDHYGTGTFDRGVLGTIGGVGVLLVLPFVGKYYDNLYRRDPAAALRFVGWLLLPAAILTPIQFFMPNVIAFTIMGIPQLILLSISFTMVGPVLQSVAPVPAAGHGRRRSGRSTSSSSVRPVARSSPVCSPTSSARAPRCS